MIANFDHRSMEAWMDLNHPATHRQLRTARVADAMSLVAATNTSAVIAPSNACLTGPDAESAKKSTDWENNPILGAVNVAQMARIAAGYNPTDLSNAGATSAEYQDFLKRLVTCPLYSIKMTDHLSVKRESSDWDSVITSIADTFEGIADKDKGQIVNGLKSLAQAASSKMETTEKESLFVQNAINVDGVISLYIYSASTSFYEKKGKGYDTKSNEFDVVRLRMEFQTALWPDYWEKIKKRFDGTVDDWISDNSTTTAGTNPIPALAS